MPASPADRIRTTVEAIRPLDREAMRLARERQGRLTKPPGSLGRLEALAEHIAGITGQSRPRLERRLVVVAAGDHGVAARGVSAYPSEVTGQMVANFLAGGAAINVLAAHAGARVRVVDAGVASDTEAHPDLVRLRLGAGKLEDSLLQGLYDTQCGLFMAQTAENIARDRGLGREAQAVGLQYAKDRVQFDVPVATFQALQHRFADLATDLDGADLLSNKAVWALDVDDPVCLDWEDVTGPHAQAVRLWRRMGFVSRDPGHNPSPSCPACGEGMPYSVGGAWRCNRCRCAVDERYLRLWAVDVPAVLGWFAVRLGLRGEARVATGRLWQLGTDTTGHHARAYFYLRGPQEFKDDIQNRRCVARHVIRRAVNRRSAAAHCRRSRCRKVGAAAVADADPRVTGAQERSHKRDHIRRDQECSRGCSSPPRWWRT